MKNMNLEVIASNLAEARHDLDDLLENLGHPGLTVRRFKSGIENILYHLVLAWNMRHLPHGHQDSLDAEEWDKYLTTPHDLRHFRQQGEPAPAKSRKGRYDRQWARNYLHRHWIRSKRPPKCR